MQKERYSGDPLPPSEKTRDFLWYGADALTSKQILIQPSTTVSIPVLVPPDARPDLSNNLPKKVATRSRFAQAGLEVKQNAGRILLAQAEVNGLMDPSSTIPSFVHVTNFGGRPLLVPQGTELFSFYEKGKPITGEELVSVMGTDIKIEGNEGREWKYVYKDKYARNIKDINGIAVRIEDGERYFIPSVTDPINLGKIAQAADYRELLRSYYQPVPRSAPVGIWFGTLPQLELSENVGVELDERIAESFNSSNGESGRALENETPRHIGARLLHPGSGITRIDGEGWKIKVEIDTRNSVQSSGYVIFRPMRATPKST